MIRWEYKHDLFDSYLNEYGVDGWELVAVVVIGDSPHYYFKRPLQPTKEELGTPPRK